MKNTTLGLVITCFTLTAFPTFSQKNYSPGYVVHLNSDTTRGLIKYNRWDRNPTTISFRRSENQEITEYTPHDIRSFSVAGQLFESATVEVDVSLQKTHELTENSEPEITKDTVFLQSLVRGEKKLFYLKDRRGKEHFYVDDDGYKLLIYKKYIRIFESLEGYQTKMIDENAGYRKQLFLYLNNCPEIQGKIERARYESDALVKLFSTYHSCINKSVSYSNARKVFTLESGVLVGATGTMLHFDGDPFVYYYILQNSHSKSVSPSLGIFLNTGLIRSRGIGLSNDLFYNSFNIEGSGVGGLGYETQTQFNFHYLKMHNIIKFDLMKNPTVFIGAGISTGLVLRSEKSIHIVYAPGSETDRNFDSKSYEFGMVGGLGVNFGKLTANARFEKSSGISNYLHLSARASRLHLLLTYRLSKSK